MVRLSLHSVVLKDTELWLYITHAPYCLCLNVVVETPPPHPQRTQAHDCWRHLSNYRMERRAAEAKLFSSVAYRVTHGQAAVLVERLYHCPSVTQ